MRARSESLLASAVAAALAHRRASSPVRSVRGRRNLDVATLGAQRRRHLRDRPRPASCSPRAERRVELDRERELRTAEAIAERLGKMKGALMKLGQMASYLDEGLPEPLRDGARRAAVQRPADERRAGRRRDRARARRAAREAVRRVGPEPIAVGQHRPGAPGRVVDPATGLERAVAVKVQYPGVGEAIEADLRNADLLGHAAASRASAGSTPTRWSPRSSERLIEELDYRLEARNQQRFADYYRGHPFIHVPDVLAVALDRRGC